MRKCRCRAHVIAAAALAALPCVRADAVDASAPAILQFFESSYRNLEKRAPDVFMAGYGGLWIPPTGRAEQGNLSVGYDVYDRFDLGSAGNPTLYGTEQGLKTAVTELHKISANVYADLVWNHNGFADADNAPFVTSGGYPGFHINAGGDNLGDFHNKSWTGDYYGRIAGLIDIAHEKNHQYIRNPVPGLANNLPAGTPSQYAGGSRAANVATEANRRFYPDLQGPSTTVNGVTYYHWNSANPSTGDPVSENATGYLMRNTRWMIEEIGFDGFRLDATKHMIDHSNANPDWVLESYDTATNAGTKTPYLNGTRKRVFGFGEYFDSNTATVQSSIKKDANANRDALDFALHYALKNNLTGNGLQNNWHNIINNTQDVQDDGLANNGSQGVAFDRSHDDGGAHLSKVANAYLMMRPGNAVIYYNAKQFGTNRDFPKDGNGDALGGLYGNDLIKLVEIRNSHGRGNYQERWIDQNTLVYERWDSALAGYSNRLDAGYDQRTVNTAFAPGTRLIELTGNAESATIDPNSDIYDVVTVAANGQATIRIPRNKAPGTNGAQHNKGYVIYGPATPRGTLSVTNVSHTIAGETPTANTNGTARLTSFEVIRQNSFEVQLQTNAVILQDGTPGGYNDLEAGGDNAVLRFDGGLNINGNASVDFTSPTGSAYGFENFLTEKNPRWQGGNGLYRQEIDATELSEGFHYITARAYRRRAAAGTPLWTDFRQVIYVDRERPLSTFEGLVPVNNAPANQDVIVKSQDKTASGVAVLYNLGAEQYTLDQIASLANNIQSPAGSYDRDLFKYGINNWRDGNNALTIVTFEPSYDPAQGYAGGGVSVLRVPGIAFNTGLGAGLGDSDFNDSLGANDVTEFYAVVRSNNTTFNPAADLNADGLVNDNDSALYLPWLTYKNANSSIFSATAQRLARALETDGTLHVPGGTLDISGTSVPGVPITFLSGFSITANKTVNKTGSQTLNINGTQNHQTNATLITSAGTTNINTNGGVNLAVTTTGAGSATNFAVTQNLRAITVADGGVATLTTASANNVNGGKALHATSITADTGKLDLKNNNLAINYTGASPMGAWNNGDYSGILGMLKDGSNSGAWNGATGITSSSAAAMLSKTALAAAEASQVLKLSGTQTALWYGHTVDATSVLVRYTWGGDATLDGIIDADDYFQIDSHYGATPGGHFTGDFNYSGAIDGDDFFIIDSNFSTQLGAMSAAPAVPAGVQSVPEPAGALLMLSAMALGMRHSGRQRRASLQSLP